MIKEGFSIDLWAPHAGMQDVYSYMHIHTHIYHMKFLKCFENTENIRKKMNDHFLCANIYLMRFLYLSFSIDRFSFI